MLGGPTEAAPPTACVLLSSRVLRAAIARGTCVRCDEPLRCRQLAGVPGCQGRGTARGAGTTWRATGWGPWTTAGGWAATATSSSGPWRWHRGPNRRTPRPTTSTARRNGGAAASPPKGQAMEELSIARAQQPVLFSRSLKWLRFALRWGGRACARPPVGDLRLLRFLLAVHPLLHVTGVSRKSPQGGCSLGVLVLPGRGHMQSLHLRAHSTV